MKALRTAVLCLFLAGIFIFTGCGAVEPVHVRQPAFEKPQYQWGNISGQTIVIWGDASSLDRPYIKKAIKRYEKLTGNTLQVKPLSKQDSQQRLNKAFQSDDLQRPDILFSQGGNAIAQFHPDENFYDFTSAPWVEDLTGTAINQAIYNGKVIGLPFSEASISGTLYNKEIFKKYGLTVPRTQVEFMVLCQKLLENGVTPVYLPYKEITMLLYQFPMDSVVSKPQTLAALNSGDLTYAQIPAMKEIVKWYRTMSEKGYFGSGYTANDWNGMNEAMKSGRYAMMLCWDTWLYTNFDGDASQFGLMPAFVGTPEAGSFEGPNLTLFIVNRKSPRLDVALDFITFLADPYNYNDAFEGVYTAPVFKNQIGSIATPQYIESDRLIDRHFYDSIAWLRLRGFSQFDARYIQRHMRDGTYSADDCLKDMDDARRARIAAQ